MVLVAVVVVVVGEGVEVGVVPLGPMGEWAVTRLEGEVEDSSANSLQWTMNPGCTTYVNAFYRQ